MRRLLAVLVLLVACGGERTPSELKLAPASVTALHDVAPLREEAERATTEARWDEAIAAYERFLAKLPEDPALGGVRDAALYNVACAHARSGRTRRAAEAFAQSVANGLRPSVANLGSGWFEVPGLSLEHVLVDADLDPIRNEPAYKRAMQAYVAAGEPLVGMVGESTERVPAIVALAAEDEDAAHALTVWRGAAANRSLVLVAVEGPVRPKKGALRWQVGDADERWAVAKIEEAVDGARRDARVDPKRIYVAGIGPRPGDAAWAGALALGTKIAGFAAPEARFDPVWRADAVAAAPVSWRVAIAPADVAAASMLKERGIHSVRTPRYSDDAATAAAILDALLSQR